MGIKKIILVFLCFIASLSSLRAQYASASYLEYKGTIPSDEVNDVLMR